jgi:tetratricopeptide (TPR) repeat protein
MRFFNRFSWFQWFLLGVFVLIFTGTVGLAFGYLSGVKNRENNRAIAAAVDISSQFELGMNDFEAGNYPLAQQRFEYVIQQNPNFPGAVDMLTETLLRLAETADITIEIEEMPTQTPSPTPDTRLADELYAVAQEQFRNQDWENLIQTITSLRDIDPLYQVGNLDRMLFLGLRFSGIDKILNEGNLEGGVYDLALVEKFAPLDSQARIYQEWARLYQIGVSFWGVFPDQAVYYFSQLVSTAPYLHDLSGIYVKDRYRLALLQYGDKLSQSGEWCSAIEQYDLAYDLLAEEGLQPTITFAEEQCRSGEIAPTSEPDLEITQTPILTLTPTLGATLEVTPEITPEITPTPGVEITPTPTPTQGEAPTPEPSPTQSDPLPTQTPEPTP